MPTIAPLLPISRDERYGVSAHTSIIENAKQNLKNLILTRKDCKYLLSLVWAMSGTPEH